MKVKTLLFLIIFQTSYIMSSDNFGIAVHGGAGVMKNLSEEGELMNIESDCLEVFDVKGAGDTVIAIISLCLAMMIFYFLRVYHIYKPISLLLDDS